MKPLEKERRLKKWGRANVPGADDSKARCVEQRGASPIHVLFLGLFNSAPF